VEVGGTGGVVELTSTGSGGGVDQVILVILEFGAFVWSEDRLLDLDFGPHLVLES